MEKQDWNTRQKVHLETAYYHIKQALNLGGLADSFEKTGKRMNAIIQILDAELDEKQEND